MTTIEKKSDFELIIAAKNSDRDAFGELYNRYYKKAFQKCLSIVRDHDEAFDLAEEALLKALNNLENFRGQASFSTWLYVIVHRHCLEFLRKKSKQHFTSIDTDGVNINITAPETDAAEKDESQKIMLSLLERMPEDERMMLTQKYSDGKSIEELQESMQLSASAVKMRLKRSKERLNEVYAVALTMGLAEALSMLA